MAVSIMTTALDAIALGLTVLVACPAAPDSMMLTVYVWCNLIVRNFFSNPNLILKLKNGTIRRPDFWMVPWFHFSKEMRYLSHVR
jgi:hypothetical protein